MSSSTKFLTLKTCDGKEFVLDKAIAMRSQTIKNMVEDDCVSNVRHSILHALILAANFLNDKEILDMICQEVADRIKGKTLEEIRKEFDIKNDFTSEEEKEIRKENAWAFE
ncbi:hypothetical protein RDI58_022719 [Solanum bulbocastanum]|uniref:SKP1-like protein n=1 Tax=Solanum bulbocastanum TaxID=147425 RepID=A0AAN8Y5J8_SOLBU